MIAPEKMRRMEAKVGGEWVNVPDMGALEAGDVFRMFEPDGTPVAWSKDPAVFEFTVAEQPSVKVADLADTDEDDGLRCLACAKPFVQGDAYYADVSGGFLHADCCGPELESYVGADGEPLQDGEPIPEPLIFAEDD